MAFIASRVFLPYFSLLRGLRKNPVFPSFFSENFIDCILAIQVITEAELSNGEIDTKRQGILVKLSSIHWSRQVFLKSILSTIKCTIETVKVWLRVMWWLRRDHEKSEQTQSLTMMRVKEQPLSGPRDIRPEAFAPKFACTHFSHYTCAWNKGEHKTRSNCDAWIPASSVRILRS